MPKNYKLRKIIDENSTAIRVLLLCVLIILSGWWGYRTVDKIRDQYQNTVPASVKIGEENQAFKNAAGELLKQSEQIQNWSILVLGGIVAILVTTKVHRTPKVEWAYLPIGPATMFLINGVFAGQILMRRYTYLTGKNNFDSILSLSSLSNAQSDLFIYSLFCLGLFAGWFLFLIVSGKVEPFETKKEN